MRTNFLFLTFAIAAFLATAPPLAQPAPDAAALIARVEAAQVPDRQGLDALTLDQVMRRFRVPGVSVAQRGQGWYFSHGGSNWGFRCSPMAQVRKGYGVVVMTNGNAGGGVIAEIEARVAGAYGWDGVRSLWPKASSSRPSVVLMRDTSSAAPRSANTPRTSSMSFSRPASSLVTMRSSADQLARGLAASHGDIHVRGQTRTSPDQRGLSAEDVPRGADGVERRRQIDEELSGAGR